MHLTSLLKQMQQDYPGLFFPSFRGSSCALLVHIMSFTLNNELAFLGMVVDSTPSAWIRGPSVAALSGFLVIIASIVHILFTHQRSKWDSCNFDGLRFMLKLAIGSSWRLLGSANVLSFMNTTYSLSASRNLAVSTAQ